MCRQQPFSLRSAACSPIALHKFDRGAVRPTAYFIYNSGSLREGFPSDLRVLFGVSEQQHWEHHVPRMLTSLVRRSRASDVVFSMLERLPLYLSAIAAAVARKRDSLGDRKPVLLEPTNTSTFQSDDLVMNRIA